jgi:hypothetical protein
MYGMVCLEQFMGWVKSTPAMQVVLVEPRKNMLDLIIPQVEKLANVLLIPKLLVHDNIPKEKTVYRTENGGFHVNYPNNEIVIGKEKCYTTSICNLVREYKIQVIDKLIININVSNCSEILTNACFFDHIISRIKIKNFTASSFEAHMFNLKCFRSEQLEENDQGYETYVNKNLNIVLPKIAMVLTEPVPDACRSSFDLLVTQYNIQVIPFAYCDKKSAPYDFTVGWLENVFSHDTNRDFELIIQFNPRYLLSSDVFKIMFPLKSDLIYLNRPFDIIYTTRNCAHMLYQILKSSFFTDHMNSHEKTRKAIFKLFRKNTTTTILPKSLRIEDYK